MKNESAYIFRKVNLMRVMKLLGGVCSKCFQYDPAIMCFHHTNPENKENIINKISTYRYSKLLYEAKKCELLCCNCHAETHSNEFRITDYTAAKIKLFNIINKHSCEKCGYNKNINALVFHHINPIEKDFDIAKRLGSCYNSELPKKLIDEAKNVLFYVEIVIGKYILIMKNIIKI